METKTNNQIAQHLADMLEACEIYNEAQNIERDVASQYYNGEMKDLIALESRSKTVSMDVRATIKKLMPSIMRTLLSNDRIVHYEPIKPEDEEYAEQASDYINYVVVPKSGAEQAIYDSIFDALLLKTGILKWCAYKRKQAKIYEYTGQPESALLGLENEKDIEILNHTISEKNIEGENIELHDFKIRRIEENVEVKLEAVSRRAFLIAPDATSIEESPIIAQRLLMTRSELVSQGFDKDAIDEITTHNESESENINFFTNEKEKTKAAQEVLVYETYAKLDLDNDGIVELYKFMLAFNQETAKNTPIILSKEAVDEIPFAEVISERQPHMFEGHSIAEDTIDIQRIKTSLIRETLDNIYWQNKKQPAIDATKLTESGLEAIYNPSFGKPITLRPGSNVNEAVQWLDVPFIADRSFAMVNYLDELIKERTGVTNQSGGVSPEAFQNMSATSANLLAQNGIAQAEMIIRTLARGGIKKAFKGLLKLVIAHADVPQTMRLKGKWVNYDPRYWNVDMDCVVNVGLGAGSKERDLSVLQMVFGLQKQLIEANGYNNPFVKPEQLYNVLEKITETAGFASATPYFTKPDKQQSTQLANENTPSLEDKKLSAQIELEQYKAKAKIAIEQEQANADIRVKETELKNNIDFLLFKAEQEKQLAIMKNELELNKYKEKIKLEQKKPNRSKK